MTRGRRLSATAWALASLGALLAACGPTSASDDSDGSTWIEDDAGDAGDGTVEGELPAASCGLLLETVQFSGHYGTNDGLDRATDAFVPCGRRGHGVDVELAVEPRCSAAVVASLEPGGDDVPWDDWYLAARRDCAEHPTECGFGEPAAEPWALSAVVAAGEVLRLAGGAVESPTVSVLGFGVQVFEGATAVLERRVTALFDRPDGAEARVVVAGQEGIASLDASSPSAPSLGAWARPGLGERYMPTGSVAIHSGLAYLLYERGDVYPYANAIVVYDPTAEAVVTTVHPPGEARGGEALVALGDRLVLESQMDCLVYSLADPRAPALVAETEPLASDLTRLVPVGPDVALALTRDGVSSLSLEGDEPRLAPLLAGEQDAMAFRAASASGPGLLALASDAALRLFELSLVGAEPGVELVEAGGLTFEEPHRGTTGVAFQDDRTLLVRGSTMVTGEPSASIVVVDVGDRAAPRSLGWLHEPGTSVGAATAAVPGRAGLVAYGSASGLAVLDLSLCDLDPTGP